jgi:hypothetical protein
MLKAAKAVGAQRKSMGARWLELPPSTSKVEDN